MSPARWIAALVGIGVVALVGVLVWGALRGGDDAAVDELPTVAEIVAAQAHQHGVGVDPGDAEASASLPPAAVSTLSAYDQVLGQLQAVKAASGVSEALSILRDVATQSPAVTTDCARIYAVLAAGETTVPSLQEICGSD